MPDQRFVHAFVFVAVDISGSGDSGPIDLGMSAFEIGRESAGGLGDDFESAHDGMDRPAVLDEFAKVDIFEECSIASTFSIMSWSLWAGLLEGIDGLMQDAVAQQRF